MKRSAVASCVALLGFLLLSVLPAVAAAPVIVSPTNMNGWVFFDDNTNGAGTGSMVVGPSGQPLGAGSASLTLTGPTDRQALLNGTGFNTTPLASITSLSYWTYQTDTTHAVTLQFGIHYTAAATTYQGRLVYEPGPGEQNPAITSGWQKWTPLTGKWWASKTSAAGSNGLCTQAAPCDWATVNANWPTAQINGALLFKVGAPWAAFTGNVDAFTFGLNGANTIYDFEPNKTASKLAGQASASVATGGSVNDTATLSGFKPTGSITFTLFGPDNGACSGTPIFTSAPVTVNGNGSYSSSSFAPTTPGTYRWIATYGGDGYNTAAATTCANSAQSVLVTAAVTPALPLAGAERGAGGNLPLAGAIVFGGLALTFVTGAGWLKRRYRQ